MHMSGPSSHFHTLELAPRFYQERTQVTLESPKLIGRRHNFLLQHAHPANHFTKNNLNTKMTTPSASTPHHPAHITYQTPLHTSKTCPDVAMDLGETHIHELQNKPP